MDGSFCINFPVNQNFNIILPSMISCTKNASVQIRRYAQVKAHVPYNTRYDMTAVHT